LFGIFNYVLFVGGHDCVIDAGIIEELQAGYKTATVGVIGPEK